MPLPKVAIVGRPNVGKSSLLNRLAGRRISIVDPTPGVTRDRVSVKIHAQDRAFELVDTGGMGLDDPDRLTDQVEAQIWLAIHEADLLLFVVDARDGITPADRDVFQAVRAAGKPMLLVANKAERQAAAADAAEFFALGVGEPLLTSAREGFGIRDLLDALLERLPSGGADPAGLVVRLAVVGKRNVGKSTLVNTLAGEQRTIASEVPGTTRDAVDIEIRIGDRTYVIIDTAGMRKKGKISDSIEFYGMVRSEEAIRRCHVAVLVTGAEMDISEVDKKLAALIVKQAKPCLLVVNKWDLVVDQKIADAARKYRDYVRKEKLPNLTFAPLEFVTAHDPEDALRVVNRAYALYEESSRRVPTPILNDEIRRAAMERIPSGSSGAPKIYYATQVATAPPCFVLFVNRPALFDRQYERYIAARIRKIFGFIHVPVKVVFRPHRD